jgi:hypothetical protein
MTTKETNYINSKVILGTLHAIWKNFKEFICPTLPKMARGCPLYVINMVCFLLLHLGYPSLVFFCMMITAQYLLLQFYNWYNRRIYLAMVHATVQLATEEIRIPTTMFWTKTLLMTWKTWKNYQWFGSIVYCINHSLCRVIGWQREIPRQPCYVVYNELYRFRDDICSGISI